jgi:hypothetical protein
VVRGGFVYREDHFFGEINVDFEFTVIIFLTMVIVLLTSPSMKKKMKEWRHDFILSNILRTNLVKRLERIEKRVKDIEYRNEEIKRKLDEFLRVEDRKW